MPHVVIKGDVKVEDIFGKFKPVFLRSANSILKTATCYLSQDKSSLLAESLAIEGGSKRSFISMITQREDGVVVRIYPLLDVEKTPGVKSILASIAKQLLADYPSLTIGETNISEYLQL